MADIQKVNFDYIRKWEGRLSKDKRDRAARHPVPDGSGYHTNIGVTWQAFLFNGPLLGYHPTPALFYEMPKEIWLRIYKLGYWDSMKADQINSQAIAEFLVDWAWGSGPSLAARKLQTYLNKHGYGLKIDGVLGAISIGCLNHHIAKKGERAVFNDLFKEKTAFLKTVPSFKTFGKGWTNRMNDFKAYAETILPPAT
jgi:lysozyme family protein